MHEMIDTIQGHIEKYGAYTVSTATLRPEDLIPAFFSALEELAPLTAQIRAEGTWAEEIQAGITGTIDAYRERNSEDFSDADMWLSECIETLQNDLSANAPDGTHFGTLEGDASEFGFWSEDTYGDYLS